MLDFSDEASQHEKCYTTIGQLPVFVDPKQPPRRKSPFSAILNHPVLHTAELIFPEELYPILWSVIESKVKNPQYLKVIMPLASLLEENFFNVYIKAGDILMISEGCAGVDEVFSLRNGILMLELGKDRYERTGLAGKPIRSGGRKHAKERFAVEIDLRAPSMLHGKRGFERIVWAFKKVLTDSVTWLFYDLASGPSLSDQDTPLRQHYPQKIDCPPLQVVHNNVLIPSLDVESVVATAVQEDIQEHCNDLAEWLALVSLGSPRISATDIIDPYLSRYAVPSSDLAKSSGLMSLKWHGMLPSQWIMNLFISLLRERSARKHAWFALTCNALGREAVESKDGYTILCSSSKPPSMEQQGHPAFTHEKTTSVRNQQFFLCWEYVGATLCS